MRNLDKIVSWAIKVLWQNNRKRTTQSRDMKTIVETLKRTLKEPWWTE